MKEVLERSGGRRRSRVSQRRQDFLALWCAPTPQVRFNTREGGEEAGRLFCSAQRERERLHSTPPSWTVGIEHPCAKRTFGFGAQIETSALLEKKNLPLLTYRQGLRAVLKLSSCYKSVVFVYQSSNHLGHFGWDSSDDRSGAKSTFRPPNHPLLLSGPSHLRDLGLI